MGNSPFMNSDNHLWVNPFNRLLLHQQFATFCQAFNVSNVLRTSSQRCQSQSLKDKLGSQAILRFTPQWCSASCFPKSSSVSLSAKLLLPTCYIFLIMYVYPLIFAENACFNGNLSGADKRSTAASNGLLIDSRSFFATCV